MSTIIIAVDLGHFKAFRISKTSLGKSKMELVESYDSLEAHGKLFDKVTDQAGRRRLDGATGGASKVKGYGEPHNIRLEEEKRLIKLIAKDINALMEREKSESWYFSASEGLNNRILEHLNPDVKARLGKNVEVDLTKSKKTDILSHFGIT
jgi:hypothetical protein